VAGGKPVLDLQLEIRIFADVPQIDAQTTIASAAMLESRVKIKLADLSFAS
jgi:hypothetical protein